MPTTFDAMPHAWWSPGGAELWGADDTYQRIEYDLLPPVGLLDGAFSWLAKPAASIDCMDYGEDADAAGLGLLVAEARRDGLVVPDSFVRFMKTPTLYRRIPSCTACYFELGARLIQLPNSSGPERLLRFMNDQQTVLLWYLVLVPDGSHRVACAWPEWRDEDTSSASSLEDCVTPCDVEICGESFEEFMKRFWIENTLWYALHEGRPAIEGELRTYLDEVVRRRASQT